MIAVTVNVRMKVTADAVTVTTTVDNPELPVRKIHVICSNKIHESISTLYVFIGLL